MFGMSRNPLASYAQVSTEIAAETADPHRLILMLFEGAGAAISKAKVHMANQEIPEKGNAISMAVDIVNNGLRASLDLKNGGELAERLAALYEYICQRLIWANLKNDPIALDEARKLLSDLQMAWSAITPSAAQSTGKDAT